MSFHLHDHGQSQIWSCRVWWWTPIKLNEKPFIINSEYHAVLLCPSCPIHSCIYILLMQETSTMDEWRHLKPKRTKRRYDWIWCRTRSPETKIINEKPWNSFHRILPPNCSNLADLASTFGTYLNDEIKN